LALSLEVDTVLVGERDAFLKERAASRQSLRKVWARASPPRAPARR
jgi:hypothetical protein